jgi:hypothetical protein
MANSSLQGYSWNIPEELHGHLKRTMNAYKGDKNVEGYKRLENLVQEPKISYEQLKRVKNFFDGQNNIDYMNDRKASTPYILNGGNKMKDWVDKTLTTARDNIQNVKDVQKQAGTSVGNTHIKTHTKDGITTNSVKPHSTSDLKIKKESYDDIYIKKEVKLMESLISIFDKNKELWQTDNKSHQF